MRSEAAIWCPICLCSTETSSCSVGRQCSHPVCRSCLAEWVATEREAEREPRCPLCRRELRERVEEEELDPRRLAPATSRRELRERVEEEELDPRRLAPATSGQIQIDSASSDSGDVPLVVSEEEEDEVHVVVPMRWPPTGQVVLLPTIVRRHDPSVAQSPRFAWSRFRMRATDHPNTWESGEAGGVLG